MSINQRLITLCDDAGIARHGAGKRLAIIAGVSVKTGNKWLNGITVPTLSSLVPLASFFGVRAEWLLNGIGDPYVIAKMVNTHALLSNEVTASGACSKLVISNLRTLTLAALNGELLQQDVDALERIIERVKQRSHLKAA